MVQTILDPTAITERLAELRTEALALRATASDVCTTARNYRKTLGSRRHDTIRAIWRARQLRYDRHGVVVAMWGGDDHPSADFLDIHRLDEVINGVVRVALVLSGIATSLGAAERNQMQVALDEMDRLIRDIRQIALERYSWSRIGRLESSAWLTRIREATAEIDALFDSGAAPLAAFDLREASQAAHRAIIALSEPG